MFPDGFESDGAILRSRGKLVLGWGEIEVGGNWAWTLCRVFEAPDPDETWPTPGNSGEPASLLFPQV